MTAMMAFALAPATAGPALAQEAVPAATVPQDGERRCRLLVQPVAQGAYITAGMTVLSACQDGSGPAAGGADVAPLVRYDRDARAVVARADLPAGTALGAIALADGAHILPAGTALRLQLRSGPVLVEREVRMLQPARPGEWVFVATAGGEVFSARIDDGMAP